jgi:hypothetical protein
MNRLFAILAMIVTLHFVAAMQGEADTYFIDEYEEDLDEDEEESDGLTYVNDPQRMLRLIKRCRNGKICKKKSDCSRCAYLNISMT